MTFIEKNAFSKKKCNHFMVWNVQGGYSYYRCSNCDYIDGKTTFKTILEEQLEEQFEGIKEIILKYKEEELKGDYSDIHFAENEINRNLIDWIIKDIDNKIIVSCDSHKGRLLR